MYDCLLADQSTSVPAHGELCIRVRHCHTNDTSRIILINSQNTSHLIWKKLKMRHNVNLTERNDVSQFCCHDLIESFVFLEYCDYMTGNDCSSGLESTFCCSNWDTFISRTHVNVIRDSGK